MTDSLLLRPSARSTIVETRARNRRLVLQQLFSARTASRADLARASGLAKATVSEICENLIQEGLISEAGLGVSTGGKPPTLLRVNPQGRFIVAVDMSQEIFTAGVFALDGRLTHQIRGSVKHPQGSEAVSELNRLILELISDTRVPALGIGVAVPGQIRSGGSVTTDRLGLVDNPIGETVQTLFDIPTFVSRPVDAAAIFEYSTHLQKGESALVYVAVDEGMAVGMVIGGRLQSAGGRLLAGPELGRSLSAEQTGIQLSALLSVLPRTRVVIGNQPTDAFLATVVRTVETELGRTVNIAGSNMGSSAVLRGAAGMVMIDQIGVLRR